MAKGVPIRIQPNVLYRLKKLSNEHCRTIGQTVEWLVKKYDKENYEKILLQELEDTQNGKSGFSFESQEEATRFLNENFFHGSL